MKETSDSGMSKCPSCGHYDTKGSFEREYASFEKRATDSGRWHEARATGLNPLAQKANKAARMFFYKLLLAMVVTVCGLIQASLGLFHNRSDKYLFAWLGLAFIGFTFAVVSVTSAGKKIEQLRNRFLTVYN